MDNATFAIIQDRHGIEQARYLLAGDDLLDTDIYAERWANSMGIELEGEEEYSIPDGCEDYSVTITENPENPAICWASANYMMKGE